MNIWRRRTAAAFLGAGFVGLVCLQALLSADRDLTTHRVLTADPIVVEAIAVIADNSHGTKVGSMRQGYDDSFIRDLAKATSAEVSAVVKDEGWLAREHARHARILEPVGTLFCEWLRARKNLPDMLTRCAALFEDMGQHDRLFKDAFQTQFHMSLEEALDGYIEFFDETRDAPIHRFDGTFFEPYAAQALHRVHPAGPAPLPNKRHATRPPYRDPEGGRQHAGTPSLRGCPAVPRRQGRGGREVALLLPCTAGRQGCRCRAVARPLGPGCRAEARGMEGCGPHLPRSSLDSLQAVSRRSGDDRFGAAQRMTWGVRMVCARQRRCCSTVP